MPLRNQAPTQVYYLSAGTLFKQCADPGVNAGECRLGLARRTQCQGGAAIRNGAIMAKTTHHRVLIIGGGTAGITVAASLKRHGSGAIDIGPRPA